VVKNGVLVCSSEKKKSPEAKMWQLTTLLPSGKLLNLAPSRELCITLLEIRLPQQSG